MQKKIAGKTDFFIGKRNLSDLGRVICLRNAQKRGEICQRTAEITGAFVPNSDFGTVEHRSLSWFLSLGGATLRYEHKPRQCKHGGARLTTSPDYKMLIVYFSISITSSTIIYTTT